MHTNANHRHLTSQVMRDNANTWRWGASLRHLFLLPVLAVALALAFIAPATAQTTFRADLNATRTLQQGPCPNGAYLCATANLGGYGAASWNMFITGYGPEYSPCGSTYAATTYLTLASDPASTLVLDETGNLCGLGHDGANYRSYFVQGSQSYGHPFAIVGTWTVDAASTGQFAGLVGSGTVRLNLAGAHAWGSYSGLLGA
jgi:hypothetical protein